MDIPNSRNWMVSSPKLMYEAVLCLSSNMEQSVMLTLDSFHKKHMHFDKAPLVLFDLSLDQDDTTESQVWKNVFI